jgi:MoxR-like ATPase
VGTRIYRPDSGKFEIELGPVFGNFLLADEINRAPAKVQSALLEVMQEQQVTLGGNTFPVPRPFLVLATQNPIESEGTYQLPEAQLDRFLFKHVLGYPERSEELEIVARHGHSGIMPSPTDLGITAVVDLAGIGECRKVAAGVRLSQEIVAYVVDLVRATRDHPSLQFGASPRAANMLATAARAYAAIEGRDYVIPDDVKFLSVPCLRHRLVLAPGAEIEGITVEHVIAQIIDQVPAPR